MVLDGHGPDRAAFFCSRRRLQSAVGSAPDGPRLLLLLGASVDRAGPLWAGAAGPTFQEGKAPPGAGQGGKSAAGVAGGRARTTLRGGAVPVRAPWAAGAGAGGAGSGGKS